MRSVFQVHVSVNTTANGRFTTRTCAFEYTGLDFAGPYYVKADDKSGHKKAYIALFVCFATKGVHIGLVGSMSGSLQKVHRS